MSQEHNDENYTIPIEMNDVECDCCGFKEPQRYLHEISTNKYLCRECHVYVKPDLYVDEFVAVFMPQVTAKAISVIFKTKAALSLFAQPWAKELADHANLNTEKLDEENRRLFVHKFNPLVSSSPFEAVEDLESLFLHYFKRIFADVNNIFKIDGKFARGEQLRHFLRLREAMDSKDRVLCDFSIRYIPIHFERERVTSWADGWLKKQFFMTVFKISGIDDPNRRPNSTDDSLFNEMFHMPSLESNISEPPKTDADDNEGFVSDDLNFLPQEATSSKPKFLQKMLAIIENRSDKK